MGEYVLEGGFEGRRDFVGRCGFVGRALKTAENQTEKIHKVHVGNHGVDL